MTQPPVLQAWHRLVRTGDAAALSAILADDAVFHSPIVHTPQRGKALVMGYLGAAFGVFFNESFRYVRELVGPRDAVLEFEVSIDGVVVNGVDMIRWNDADLITEFKVMVRPLKAIELIHRAMARMLEQRGVRSARAPSAAGGPATGQPPSATASPSGDTALLVIDVQAGLCSGAEEAHDVARIIERINALSGAARAAGRPVVLVQHEEDGGLLERGAPAWQLDAALSTSSGDLRVRKRVPSALRDTPLAATLRERGITRLVVCGLQTDCCVDATTRHARELGFDVALASDAHSTVASGGRSAEAIIASHNEALRSVATLASSHDLARELAVR